MFAVVIRQLLFFWLLTKLQIGQPVLVVQTHQRGIDLKPAERRPDWQLCTLSVFPQQTSTLGEPLPCCFHQTASSQYVPLPAGKPHTHEGSVNGHFCQLNKCWLFGNLILVIQNNTLILFDSVQCFEFHYQQQANTGVNIVSFNPMHCCDPFGQNTHL